MTIERTTDPATNAVLTTLVEQQLYISSGESALVVANAITSAIDTVEADTDRSLITQSWTMTMDGFPEIIYLPKGKVQSITAFTYIDTSDAVVALVEDTDYTLTTVGAMQRILPIGDWASTYSDKHDTVSIEWVSGYGDADTDIPGWAKSAILLKVKEQYDGTDVAVAYAKQIATFKLYFDYNLN
jgi:uncharacterized phiE125 gp8 family phage protein